MDKQNFGWGQEISGPSAATVTITQIPVAYANDFKSQSKRLDKNWSKIEVQKDKRFERIKKQKLKQ